MVPNFPALHLSCLITFPVFLVFFHFTFQNHICYMFSFSRLLYSKLLIKHLSRSRANRRLVYFRFRSHAIKVYVACCYDTKVNFQLSISVHCLRECITLENRRNHVNFWSLIFLTFDSEFCEPSAQLSHL